MAGLSEEAARELFGTARVVRLATVDEQGAPHLVVATFAVSGDRVYMAVDHKPKRTRSLKRLRNIAGEPRVSLLADRYEDDWRRLWWVRADGDAAVGPDAGAVDLLAARYPQYREHRPQGPVVTVTVRRWTGWIYESPGGDVPDGKTITDLN